MHLSSANLKKLVEHVNHSPELTKYLKQNKNKKIYAFHVGMDEPTDDGYKATNKFETILKNNGLQGMFIYLSTSRPKEVKYSKNAEVRPIWIVGRKVNSLCVVGRPKTETMEPTPYPVRELRLITDKFFEEYLKAGRCSFSNDFHEYDQISSRTRVCKHCGKKQTRKSQMVKVTRWV